MGGDKGGGKTGRAGGTETKSILRREPGCWCLAFDTVVVEMERAPEVSRGIPVSAVVTSSALEDREHSTSS